MKLATNIKKIDDFGFQLIIENSEVLGVNILISKKILVKKRFEIPVSINSKKEEIQLVNSVIIEILKN